MARLIFLKMRNVHAIEKKWDELFLEIGRENEPWIYRGSIGAAPLETSLERACRASGVHCHDRGQVERNVIREFQRKFESIASDIHLPPQVDTIWWLTVMQHHGAPTRLIDFSYSPFIAAYFALERCFHAIPDALVSSFQKIDNKAVIWAIRLNWLYEEASGHIHDEEQFDAIRNSSPGSLDFLFDYTQEHEPFVHQANAYYLNERLSIQQGLFLCQSDMRVSFEENLGAVKNWDSAANIKKYIILDYDIAGMLNELNKMNINRTSLFPGLDGFARSLFTRAAFIPSSSNPPVK